MPVTRHREKIGINFGKVNYGEDFRSNIVSVNLSYYRGISEGHQTTCGGVSFYSQFEDTVHSGSRL